MENFVSYEFYTLLQCYSGYIYNFIVVCYRVLVCNGNGHRVVREREWELLDGNWKEWESKTDSDRPLVLTHSLISPITNGTKAMRV